MKKAIVIIRTSSIKQEIDAQKKEIYDYAKSYGYKDNEIIVVGDKGASAIKLNDLYMKNLNLIYKYILDYPIEAVFAWSLDRIARKDNMLLEFKNYLIEHKVNLLIKNPSLTLFNPDGTVNNGIELAMSLFATMAQQEMIVKQERFMRAKKAMSVKGMFIGGKNVRYGYRIEDGYYVIDEAESKIIHMLYKMYSTGKYSMQSLTNELNERGIQFRGHKFSLDNVNKILSNVVYLGHNIQNKLVKSFPAIITQEEYDRAKYIRLKKNSNIDKSTKNISLAVKILKCFECGSNYMRYESTHEHSYKCRKRIQKGRLDEKDRCLHSCPIKIDTMDEILKDLAIDLKHKYTRHMNDTKRKELEDRKVILEEKMSNLQYELEHIDNKFSKVVDAYTDDILSKKEYDSRIGKLKTDKQNYITSIKQYKDECISIDRMLDNKEVLDSPRDFISGILNREAEYNDTDIHILKQLVDQYIKVAYPKEIIVNGVKFTLVMVVDYDNNIYNYLFYQKHYKNEELFVLNTNTLEQYNHRVLTMVNGVTELVNTKKTIREEVQLLMNDENAMKILIDMVGKLNDEVRTKI